MISIVDAASVPCVTDCVLIGSSSSISAWSVPLDLAMSSNRMVQREGVQYL